MPLFHAPNERGRRMMRRTGYAVSLKLSGLTAKGNACQLRQMTRVIFQSRLLELKFYALIRLLYWGCSEQTIVLFGASELEMDGLGSAAQPTIILFAMPATMSYITSVLP